MDITSQSYAYFSHLIDLSGPIKLDMLYTGLQSKGNYGYNMYSLKGEAPFDSFYRFIWYLENDRKLYKIANMTVKGLEVAGTEKHRAAGARDLRHAGACVLLVGGGTVKLPRRACALAEPAGRRPV